MKLLVLYHANCWDGFCAAWICHSVHGKAEYVPVQYGQMPPDVTGRDVLIIDFSYPREQLLAMKAAANSLEVLDHHKTAAEALAGLDFCVFDQSKSGGRLTWEKFYGSRPSPWLVDYTEDRDLWTWKLPASREINASLRTLPLDFDAWDLLNANPDATSIMRTEGAAILRAEKMIVDQHVRNAHEIVIDGHKVLCVNATSLHSEIAGELAKGRPFGVCWFEGDDNERVYSLRSRAEGIDVSEIAKAHGGGGHRNAAGFRVRATGATGLFTEGQISSDDEGELKMAIGADREAGIVRVDFGKPVGWLGLPKADAKHFAGMIVEKANLLD